jgi:hypothetical protein
MLAGCAFILSGVRTPIGARGGALAEVPCPDLGAVCIREALKRAGIGPSGRSPLASGQTGPAGPPSRPWPWQLKWSNRFLDAIQGGKGKASVVA